MIDDEDDDEYTYVGATKQAVKVMLGKVVQSIHVSDDEQFLKFTVQDDTFVYWSTWGDCCSETWFADIIGVDNLIDNTVTDVSILEFNDDELQDDRCRQEHDRFYGVRLSTVKGTCDIIFRNSSNGYYGGEIRLASEEDMKKEAESDICWFQIEKDWQAGESKYHDPFYSDEDYGEDDV